MRNRSRVIAIRLGLFLSVTLLSSLLWAEGSSLDGLRVNPGKYTAPSRFSPEPGRTFDLANQEGLSAFISWVEAGIARYRSQQEAKKAAEKEGRPYAAPADAVSKKAYTGYAEWRRLDLGLGEDRNVSGREQEVRDFIRKVTGA